MLTPFLYFFLLFSIINIGENMKKLLNNKGNWELSSIIGIMIAFAIVLIIIMIISYVTGFM